ncbi:MAG TPA: SUMF1/EgtB/PvdO family nonheme iron enzyme [Pyrinomonadaceae bacterium]
MSKPTPEQNEAFALIIDTSSSAAADLDQARQTAQRIYRLIGAEQFKIFMLGSATPISSTALKQTTPPGVNRQPQPCSLIAPIMETLVREEQKHSVIIVGSGEIFDLDDWTGDPRVEGWLLVYTSGEPSLQKPGGRIAEISAVQIGSDADTLLSYFSRPATRAPESPPACLGLSDADAFRWRVDASGYPLVFVEPLDAYAQLFPVTKPQFERFVSSCERPEYDDGWYEEILTLNPRASYRSADVLTRERLFMTGVTPDEALAFGRWMGRDYALPTAEEWATCYKWFGGQAALSAPPDLCGRLSPDALSLWETIEGQWLEPRRRPTLRDLSLMTQGILEWVAERPSRYCGLGEPAASKLQRRAEDPVRPVGRRRLRNLGFRLLTR